MSILRFSDGEVFDTSGPLRKELRMDGWYIIGNGILKPMRDENSCDEYLKQNALSKSNSLAPHSV